MCVIGQRLILERSNIEPPFSTKKESNLHDRGEEVSMPLHHAPPEAHPATVALFHAVVLQRRQRQRRGCSSPNASKSFSTDSCSSSSSSSSDEDPAEYLEHLSIRKADPSLRGLVRSMAIRENLCDLLRRGNNCSSEIIHSPTPISFVGALPPADIQPFVVLDTDTIGKRKQMEEDSVSLDPVASKNQSSQLRPLLPQHPARLS